MAYKLTTETKGKFYVQQQPLKLTKTRKRVKKKGSEGLVEEKSVTGPQQDFASKLLHKLKEEDIPSFRNYLRMDPIHLMRFWRESLTE